MADLPDLARRLGRGSFPEEPAVANGDPIWSTMLVEDPHQDGANRPPPVGQHYVVAHVAMTNYGEQTVAYSARRFTLEGVDDHRRYDALDVFGKCSHRSSRGAR